ncbi:hypothetical protein D6745_05365 [Candidatus Woesearchaeota archaeon]|nr:MAG: hypothetical protein D6745_05365 [Candidatus Woesearchaeota archaeon]
MKKEVVDYLKEQLRKGFSEEQLRAALKSEGYDDKDIDDTFREIKNKENDEISKTVFIYLGVFVVFGIISAFLLKLSGLTQEFFMRITSSFFALVQGNAEVSFLLVFLGIISASVSLASFFAFNLRVGRMHYFALVSAALVSITAGLLAGFTLAEIFVFLASLATLLFFSYNTETLRKTYKTLHVFRLASHNVSSAWKVFGVAIAVFVFITLTNDHSYVNNEFNVISQKLIGGNISDINEIQRINNEIQLNNTLQLLEVMENLIAFHLVNDSTLSDEERSFRYANIQESIRKADEQIKKDLINEYNKQVNSAEQKEAGIKAKRVLEAVKKVYPIMTAFTVFIIIEVFGFFVKVFTALFSFIIWQFFEKKG